MRVQQRDILAIVSPDDLSERTVFEGFAHFRHDNDVFQFGVEDIMLVNGIGMLASSSLKRKVNQHYLSHGYQFETLIANNAHVSPYAELEAGVQILPRAIVQAGANIANHTIINSGAIVEHDCKIGEYNHIAPGSTLCGQVKTGENVYIGAGATVIQNITLAQNVIVGAGAVVTEHLLENEVCYPGRAAIKRVK